MGAGLGVHRQLDRIDAADAAQRRLQPAFAAQARRQPTTPLVAVAEDQAVAVNAAVGQLNLPWHDVFDALESATSPNVALLALEPDARHHVVHIEAEVGSTDEMLRYVEQLKQQAFLVSVFLTRHEVNANDPNQPLRFQVEAHWRDAPGAAP
jgi:Tfp pilus assembly protein PilN